MNAKDKVKASENAYTKSIGILEDALDKDNEVDPQSFKAAVTLANNHIKLMNIVKGSEALGMAKQRYALDWANAYAQSKDELRQLLNKKALK